MIHLRDAARAWGSDTFKQVLKREIEQLDASALPLQQGLARSSAAADDTFETMIVRVAESDGWIAARAGVFYKGVIGGCSCADDPTPMDTIDEYCEIDIALEPATGVARITLVTD